MSKLTQLQTLLRPDAVAAKQSPRLFRLGNEFEASDRHIPGARSISDVRIELAPDLG